MLIDLRVTPIAEALRNLAAQRRSGDLLVQSGKVAKTVFFNHGRVVFAASNLKKDRLGEALVALGRISEQDFERATSIMQQEQRRFGDALVKSGVLDKSELGTSVARQVRRIVLSLFELSEGAASFEERPCPIPLEYMVSLSIHRLLFEGIQSMKDQDLVLAGLGDLDRWVTLAAVPPFAFDPKHCAKEAWEILEQTKRRATLRRLAWAQGGLSLSKLRTVYSFWASGLLQDASPDATATPQPVVQTETGMFLLSALQRKPDPSAFHAIRQEVEQELAHSANLDRETWLKVSRTAPRDELVKALEEKMERYQALLDAVGDNAGLKKDIEVIIGRAGRAAALLRPAPETPEPASEETRQPPAAEAARVPKATAPPPGSEEPAKAAPAAGESRPPVDLSMVKMQIENLLTEGEVRMTVSDYANAVKVYAKIVEFAPNVALYRAKLALAMACYPRTAKQAERQFLEAIDLDPQNADYHYQFGLYYKAMKQRSRAVAEMRTALSLNSRHRGAREELETLAPKDSALKSLKKLFS